MPSFSGSCPSISGPLSTPRDTARLASAAPPKRDARGVIADERLSAVFGIELEAGRAPRSR